MDGIDLDRLLPIAFFVFVLWLGLGLFWLEQLKELSRRHQRQFEFRLPLQQWMLVVLGLSIQVGLLVKCATSPQIGWLLFVFLPPLFTWGLLETIEPITGPAVKDSSDEPDQFAD